MPSNKPSMDLLRAMQLYSTRGWVYREGQGWIFAELTPEELAEFKSYKCGITIPRMRVRVPHGMAYRFYGGRYWGYDYANSFAYYTMPQIPPLGLAQDRIHQIAVDNSMGTLVYPVEPGSYETWLWADEVKIYRERGCEITVHQGFGWFEWGVPPEWKAPLQYKERIFIYALIDELARQVYVGQTDNLTRRQAEHMRDTENSSKVALIQSLCAQGGEPKLLKLEEVAGEKAIERERYWTSYYKRQGYKIINQDYRSLSGFSDTEGVKASGLRRFH